MGCRLIILRSMRLRMLEVRQSEYYCWYAVSSFSVYMQVYGMHILARPAVIVTCGVSMWWLRWLQLSNACFVCRLAKSSPIVHSLRSFHEQQTDRTSWTKLSTGSDIFEPSFLWCFSYLSCLIALSLYWQIDRIDSVPFASRIPRPPTNTKQNSGSRNHGF